MAELKPIARLPWRSSAALEVVYHRDGEQVARNVQPLEVEPGKFNYRLVRAELEFAEYGTIHARCRVDLGPETGVPYTLLPPPDAPAPASDPAPAAGA